MLYKFIIIIIISLPWLTHVFLKCILYFDIAFKIQSIIRMYFKYKYKIQFYVKYKIHLNKYFKDMYLKYCTALVANKFDLIFYVISTSELTAASQLVLQSSGINGSLPSQDSEFPQCSIIGPTVLRGPITIIAINSSIHLTYITIIQCLLPPKVKSWLRRCLACDHRSCYTAISTEGCSREISSLGWMAMRRFFLKNWTYWQDANSESTEQ